MRRFWFLMAAANQRLPALLSDYATDPAWILTMDRLGNLWARKWAWRE